MSVANLGKTTHLNYSGKVSMKRLIGKDFYGKAEKVPKLQGESFIICAKLSTPVTKVRPFKGLMSIYQKLVTN